MAVPTSYHNEAVTIAGREAVVDVTLRDYLPPQELSALLDDVLKQPASERSALLRQHGISNLVIRFAPVHDL